jgi:hypothetical protein
MAKLAYKRRIALTVVIAAFLAVPAASWAADRFTDVPDSNTFHDDIGWLADAGITLGCNPPDNTEFCPGSAVTRQQMSAFMRRLATYLGAEDGTPAQADNATTADSATTADNADMLDGLDSEDFLAKLPVAHALIDNDASATVDRGFGITGGSRVSTGVYCLELDPALGLTESDIMVSVTVDWFASSGDDLFAQWSSSSFGNCASGEFMVRTFDDVAGINESNDVRFTVLVFRANTPTPAAIVDDLAPTGNGS